MRKGELERVTKETKIRIEMNLDGTGQYAVKSGIGFFDHMLELFSCHSGIDLIVQCEGDIKVDGHHSVEDIGIVMGKLLNSLLGNKAGIARYATSYIPMDESLARTVLDLSGRPYLDYNNSTMCGIIGDFDTQLVEEFFRAVTSYGLITLHIDVLKGSNNHHIAEAIFKSFAHALKEAIKIVGKVIPSSKGLIE